MFELIKSIKGEDFLVIYLIYVIVILAVVYFFYKRDFSGNLEMPDPSSLSPLEISYLVNGIKSVLATSIFNMWRKKVISLKTNKRMIVVCKNKVDVSGLNDIEQKLYNSIKRPTNYNFLLTKSSLETYECLFVPYKQTLLSKAFIYHEKEIKRVKKFRNISYFLIFPLGLIKLAMGFYYGKDSGYLVLILILLILIVNISFKYKEKGTTKFGKQFLKQCKQRFLWIKETPANERNYHDDIFLYYVAVFGFSSIIGDKLGSRIDNPLVFDGYGSGFSGSGCSGGGCGGGSGCGGGCGGCGGD